MNLSAKCNCCVCESVCKFKEIYEKGVESILNATISNQRKDSETGFWKVKDCPHIEVSIKCPHMITRSATREINNG